ncbi:hypothetical protein POVWA1_007940 [Plasmodium ovale wallikeri]|uniref:Uncharacterized protein n=1 Tax=Plasmodium ovale wallikeri TaxID=864142 RepID=A0A1A8YJ92_PLAOA|nr:hypothetical protein POVWA1_007940 [Plasmodium ovale wallikeri]
MVLAVRCCVGPELRTEGCNGAFILALFCSFAYVRLGVTQSLIFSTECITLFHIGWLCSFRFGTSFVSHVMDGETDGVTAAATAPDWGLQHYLGCLPCHLCH